MLVYLGGIYPQTRCEYLKKHLKTGSYKQNKGGKLQKCTRIRKKLKFFDPTWRGLQALSRTRCGYHPDREGLEVGKLWLGTIPPNLFLIDSAVGETEHPYRQIGEHGQLIVQFFTKK